jgi:hypothetical protein
LHLFHAGRLFTGQWYRLYSSYFSDFIIPFGAYFLLTLSEEQFPFLRAWYGKAGVVFVLACASEIAQYFGVYALGVTFDPLDILTYAAGALVAALVEVRVFARLVRGWSRPV